MSIKRWNGSQIGALIGFIFGVIIAIVVLYLNRTNKEYLNFSSFIFLLIIVLLFTILCFLIGFLLSSLRNWEKLKYWKKGATIGIIINSILSILLMALTDEIGVFFGYVFSVSHLLPYSIATSLHLCAGEDCTGYVLLSFLWIPFFGFFIGALCGLLVKKVLKFKKSKR